MKLRLAGLIHESLVDGPGFRSVVFVQGCPHRCQGCHSPQTQPFKGGHLVEVEKIARQILARPLLDGITLSGGEPFTQSEALLNLVEKIFATKKLNLWIYSGFLFEQLLIKMGPEKKEIMRLLKLANVLVDGPFILSKRNLSLPFRGSSNQRIINLPQTLKKGKIILWQEGNN